MSARRLAALALAAPLVLAASRAEARGCHERSEIVGKQRCSRFGDFWDVSETTTFVVSAGPSILRYPVTGLGFDATVTEKRGDGVPLRFRGDGRGRWTSVGASLRMAWFLPRVFYLGGEGFAGGTFVPSADALPFTAPNGEQGLPVPAFTVHMTGAEARSLGGIAGVSLPLWRFDFSLEAFGGFRAVSPDLEWTSLRAASKAGGGCWPGNKGLTACPTVDAGWTYTPRVEPRVGVAFRLTPWVTLRGLGGFDVLGHGAWSGTLLVEVHTRVYDGFPKRRRAADPE